MQRSKQKEQVCKSMREFGEKFFPKSFRKQSIEVPTDARALGISSARESLDMVRRRLSK
jgi:hypothetical protein